ncbi:YbaY family lipoprotein [Shewanella gaetbuli]|uniref:YbaY family lipoprotein n=1 Tax=Shewanella gaetbuli TaxID=220752 RepID=A0A9X1ZNW7_9GAMM|nr:YbaY family lipoprotein [Shewanella gaetbuli]MCL1143355.1 YbaY family lipoprotein [Shewanella gaetbuli]
MKQILSVATMVIGLSACQSSVETVSVSGEVIYKQRIALPANSVINIQLQDVSLQDVKAVVLAEYELSPVSSVTPFEFVLPKSDFVDGHRYSIRAKISVDNSLKFINTQSYPVDISQSKPITVVVDAVN